jgi:asparagine synthetase B (glutamine-hydrolysing)
MLSRDRFGIEPHCLFRDKGRLLLASEIKAILAAVQRRFTINPVAVRRFLEHSLLDGQTETFFAGSRRCLQAPARSSIWLIPPICH